MPEILKDRNYYRMLPLEYLVAEVLASDNEMALAIVDALEDAAHEVQGLKDEIWALENRDYDNEEDES